MAVMQFATGKCTAMVSPQANYITTVERGKLHYNSGKSQIDKIRNKLTNYHQSIIGDYDHKTNIKYIDTRLILLVCLSDRKS